MSIAINCWEFKRCGREPGGANVHELGICPAAIAKNCDGIHGGICGGRACWAISGTLCNGRLQGTSASKLKNCLKCDFYQQVQVDTNGNGNFLGADEIIHRNHPDESITAAAPHAASDPLCTALIKVTIPAIIGDLHRFLKKKSFQVTTAATGQELVDHTAQTQPDIIILSVTLHDMEGFSTCSALRTLANGRDIPVIFITPDSNRVLQSKGFRLGALAILPIDEANFWDELEQKLQRIQRLKVRMRGLTALVIDTNLVSQRVINACLEQQGVSVINASDDIEAKAIILGQQTIDLVVSEVFNANFNGLDFCRYLRKLQNFATTPIILLCPEQFRVKILKVFQAGATDYIIKPCPREELLARLLIHIESQQVLKELTCEVQKNKLLLDSAGEGIVGLDLNGQITFVNQAAARLLGYLADELMGKNLHGLTHHTTVSGENYSFLDCPIQQSLEHGTIVTISDDIFWRSDNSTMPAKYISTPIINNDGICGAVVTFSDITAEKKDEAMRQDIERITRHDLKTPLNGIIGIPGMLLEDDNLTDRQRNFLELLKDSGYRMLEMINESLNMFKMEKGTYEFCPLRVDLLTIIRTILAESMELKAKGLAVVITVDGIPRAEGDSFLVQGEKLLCYSMLANLLKNAIEASPEGGTINIALNQGAPMAEISIQNQGVVPFAIRERFFDKYSTAGKSGGTGLGTYSAKLIATTQKGSITMTTDQEHGTTLLIKLPVWPTSPQRKSSSPGDDYPASPGSNYQ